MAQAKTAEGTQFSIHVQGEETGKTWNGDFRAKALLTFREKLAADRLKRDLLGGDGAGASTESIVNATVIGELSVRLTETPEWWKGGLDLQDFNVLKAVWDEAQAIEKAHLEKVKGEGAKAAEKLRADEPEKK